MPIEFPVGPSGWTRGNRRMLKHRKFCPNMRKYFFTLRVVRHWSRFPREAMRSPSVEIFKTQVDVTMGKLLQLALL